MWKLILADSFHLNHTSYQTSLTSICMSIYISFLYQSWDSRYRTIMLILYILLILSFMISPIRITKGLYLCPLTEKDRKRYLKLAFLFRYICYELLFAVVMISAVFIKQYDYRILLLIYISISIVFLMTLLLSGFYNPEIVKRQYLIMNKLPVPIEKQPSSKKKQSSQNGVYLLVITMFISIIALFIPVSKDLYDNRWLFFYIPAYILCFLCLQLYFSRHFDSFITINANYEIYSFTHKKKAGVH